MTTNQTSYAGGAPMGKSAAASTSEEPVIPTQREAPDGRPAIRQGGEQQPIVNIQLFHGCGEAALSAPARRRGDGVGS